MLRLYVAKPKKQKEIQNAVARGNEDESWVMKLCHVSQKEWHQRKTTDNIDNILAQHVLNKKN